MDHVIPPTIFGVAPLLELRQAVFSHNSRKAVHPPIHHPINWTIRTGERWAVLGATGSGKSALIDAILKKIPLIGGQVLYYFDRSGDAEKPGRSFFDKGDILHVSTGSSVLADSGSPGFYQARWHSMQELDTPVVADYLRPETVHRISKFEVTPQRTPDRPNLPEPDFSEMGRIVSLMGIEDLMPRRVQHLSHGEFRKVLIARALIQRPKLLILDDPFAGLDIRSRKRFRRILENFPASGDIHILLVTARPEDIPDSITHILRMDDGRIFPQNPKNVRDASTDIRTGSGPIFLAEPDSPELPHPQPEDCHGRPDVPVIIHIKNTCVTYDKVTILDHINWQVRQGERWAVLGPNGAGKSTLLSLILADNPQAYANDITLFGRKRGTGETIWEVKRPVGWMSPELQIYYKKDTTGLDVVCSGFFDSIGLHHACTARQMEIAREWMDVLEIRDLENHLFARISEGRQRILLLARALVKSPKLLVLDEPCQGLDRETRERVIRLIGQVCRRMSASLLYVSHDMNELPGAITHMLTLDNGKVTGCGPCKNNGDDYKGKK